MPANSPASDFAHVYLISSQMDGARRMVWMLTLQASNFNYSLQISSNMDGAMKF